MGNRNSIKKRPGAVPDVCVLRHEERDEKVFPRR